MDSSRQKFRWVSTSKNHWSSRLERGYTAAIVYTAGSGYSLTITGSGAPGAAVYITYKLAKNAFRKFLHDK